MRRKLAFVFVHHSVAVCTMLFGALVESNPDAPTEIRRQRRRMRRQQWLANSSSSSRSSGGGGGCSHARRSGTRPADDDDDDDDVGTFWHVTDWHVNEFQPEAHANPCDMCRSAAAPSACPQQPSVGPFGHIECDPAPAFWKLAIDVMRRVEPSPDFLLAGGDWIGHIPPHREGPSALRSAATRLATALHDAFPRVPTLHTIGNHDTWPYYSASAPTWLDWEAAWRTERRLGDAYVAFQFPDDSLAAWRSGGYYLRPLRRGKPDAGSGRRRTLWGLVLNTNDLALTGGVRQCHWLARTLGELRASGERAILLGHIPPGPSHFELDSICAAGHYYQTAGGACWDGRAQRRVLHLLATFADVVPASYFGHHHTDR